ncbi:Glutamate-ammonia-ligase adenylyltransferase [Planctomycetes bacterium Pan216]|uniref:Glutamate-ammonia-ligase adenylyltransferase n=1 Tax=Kolteria novifilia TaxID=2527975 RepID=A0A518B4Z9_9BACT|nr:Glutamate-ammonia-ligase adenylyltransferase [Planctomycetes bacterium Pan216]
MPDSIETFLDSDWLKRCRFTDESAARRNIAAIAGHGIPDELVVDLCRRFAQYLPSSADPDMVLNNIERMLDGVEHSAATITFLLNKPHALAILIQLFASSQYFSDLIIRHPEHFDFLWEHGHRPIDPRQKRSRILREIHEEPGNEKRALRLIRRHRQRELLRIGYRDIILGEPLERITASISDLADCLVEVSLTLAYQKISQRHGEPRSPSGRLARVVVLGMGKLGGRELNYSSDIDLIVVYDVDGKTDGEPPLENYEFYSRVVREIVRYLSALTEDGQAYRVDLRLRPHGAEAPLCLSLANTLAYYERFGRNWERQALVKARSIAGSYKLGDELLKLIAPFVYARHLHYAEINDLKAMKRRIQEKTRTAGAEDTDLKTGHGGIRDIEFVVQFLQLINGGVLPAVRERNTIKALRKLADAGCIRSDELTSLETAYRFLRKAEHRLQFMFDLQTHRIPQSPSELNKLALRLGYLSGNTVPPSEQFVGDLRRFTARNRAILNRLMLDLFPPDPDRQAKGEPETDLIFDPNPEQERIEKTLGRYLFSNIPLAYKNLTLLAREDIPFLSSLRCRHFLASIAPRLMKQISEAPDPDMALVNLEKVTASLGAKGALWESLSINPALLRLYVNLCSWSQYLSEILINNPGMIDELLDSLAMNKVANFDSLKAELDHLLKGAEELDPILHGFKNTWTLEIGIRDVLGKTTQQEILRELSELARAMIASIADYCWDRLVEQYGEPRHATRPSRISRYCLIGLGTLGAGELMYHSDLDLVLVYDKDGMTNANGKRLLREPTSNHQFFTELAQRIVRTAGHMGPMGRLYSIDLRLRPSGQSGSLALPLEKFSAYYRSSGSSHVWERLALTRGRAIHGDLDFADRVNSAIRNAVCRFRWKRVYFDEIDRMRRRLEASRGPQDLKRASGGIVDVEFAVQMIQLRHGGKVPEILEPNLWKSLEMIGRAGLWDKETVKTFEEGYSFLRAVDSRLRIVHNLAPGEMPDTKEALTKLALRLGYEGADAAEQLTASYKQHTEAIRQHFRHCLELERERTRR